MIDSKPEIRVLTTDHTSNSKNSKLEKNNYNKTINPKLNTKTAILFHKIESRPPKPSLNTDPLSHSVPQTLKIPPFSFTRLGS